MDTCYNLLVEVIYMLDLLVFILDIIGTVAFAVSGAITGTRREMDIFGVSVLGIITAVGGGVIRDLTLGVTPPQTFQHPVYTLVAIAVSVVIFLPGVRRFCARHSREYDLIMLLMDSLGLGLFTVLGVQYARKYVPDASLFLMAFEGVITGVGGGVIRDVLAGLTPYILKKHFYACASIIGALVCGLLSRTQAGMAMAMAAGAAVVVLLRLLAAKYYISLPRARTEESDNLL